MTRHKNAGWTREGNRLLVERIRGISPRTARKWLERFQEDGVQGLHDRRSRPTNTCANLDAALHERIEHQHRSRRGIA